jgi:hypothetical protein
MPRPQGVIDERMKETGENWRLVYKSLLLLEYMVKHGPLVRGGLAGGQGGAMRWARRRGARQLLRARLPRPPPTTAPFAPPAHTKRSESRTRC